MTEGDKLVAAISKLLRKWDKLLGAPPCPCCGAQMQFVDGDEFGTVHAKCKTHGEYTFQVTP